jgi:single-stranded-DNA-specific exonuclease
VPAFLDIEASLTGRQWRLAEADGRIAEQISQRLALPEVLGRVLAARRIDIDAVESFLNPTLRDLLPDPLHLLDMEKAAERLAAAVEAGEIIGLFGDYDVDGATSAALLQRYFAAVGAETLVHIPDRMIEGYGPNAPALIDLQRQGAKVVVTVDCGITAFEALAAAAEAGLAMIVVDHHEAEAQLPAAFAIINPNRLDETSPHGQLAAVGVAFLLVVAVQKKLKEAGWFAGRPAPDLLQWLDIVALGTVCDVVPLTGVNRALVAQGLKVLARRGNAGIAALADIAGVSERIEAYHLGYLLGPRVNAGGRVGQADLGVRLLATDDPGEAVQLAKRLDHYNKERQAIEAGALAAAIEQVDSLPDDGAPLLIAHADDWHPGVIGIIAGRLKERYGRPTCVIAFDGDEGKGSGRSVPGLDLGGAVIAARQAGLLLKGGGHAMAAGFTVTRRNLEALRQFLAERLRAQLEGPLKPLLQLDGALDPAGATLELVEILSRLAPFGSGNAEPRFALIEARVSGPRIVGNNHVACTICGRNGGRLKAIAFRSADTGLGQALLANDGTPLHIAGTLRIDSWQGRHAVQMFIEDAAPISH